MVGELTDLGVDAPWDAGRASTCRSWRCTARWRREHHRDGAATSARCWPTGRRRDRWRPPLRAEHPSRRRRRRDPRRSRRGRRRERSGQAAAVVVVVVHVGPEQRRASGDGDVLAEERARGVGHDAGGQGAAHARRRSRVSSARCDQTRPASASRITDGEHLGDHRLDQPHRERGRAARRRRRSTGWCSWPSRARRRTRCSRPSR